MQFFHLKVTLINERGKNMKLEELAIGKSAVILSVGGEGALRQHFLDMGLIQGTEITMVKYAPMGDPVELRIHGYELTIRLADAAQIEVSTAHDKEKQEKTNKTLLFIVRPSKYSYLYRIFKINSNESHTIKRQG